MNRWKKDECIPLSLLKFSKYHLRELVLGELIRGVSSKSSLQESLSNLCFLSNIGPKIVNKVLNEESRIMVMNDEFN